MNHINCFFEACPEVFHTEEPISPNARYICRKHTPKDQANAARFDEYQFQKRYDSFAALRKYFDGQDEFMVSHQIIEPRRPEQLPPPDWIFDDTKTAAVLRRLFPKADENSSWIEQRPAHKHRIQARAYAAVINGLKRGLDGPQVEADYNLKPGRFKEIAYHLRSLGDDSSRTGKRRGRPPKLNHSPAEHLLGKQNPSAPARAA